MNITNLIDLLIYSLTLSSDPFDIRLVTLGSITVPSAVISVIGIPIIFSAFSYSPTSVTFEMLPSITLSIILYKLIAITGINNIRFGFMCFVISFKLTF